MNPLVETVELLNPSLENSTENWSLLTQPQAIIVIQLFQVVVDIVVCVSGTYWPEKDASDQVCVLANVFNPHDFTEL